MKKMARNGQVKDQDQLLVKHFQLVPLGKKMVLRKQF